jgi:hypothetical protein
MKQGRDGFDKFDVTFFWRSDCMFAVFLIAIHPPNLKQLAERETSLHVRRTGNDAAARALMAKFRRHSVQ